MRMSFLGSLLLMLASAPVLAAGTAFTYQGQLLDLGTPADGVYDFQLDLYEHPSVGAPLNPVPLLFDDVQVSDGVFVLSVDFGASAFTGPDRWLAIRVRPGASTGAFTPLLPRQPLSATPYAQHANDAGFAASVAPGSVGGTEIVASEVQRRVVGACPAGQAIRVVAEDGNVTCQAAAAGDITAVLTPAGSGLEGGASSGDVSLAIAPGGVNSGRIADGAVTAAKIDASEVQRRVGNACPSGQAIRAVGEDGTVTCEALGSALTWNLTGNAGTDAGSDFLGTSDAVPLLLRVNNQRIARLEPQAGDGTYSGHNLVFGHAGNALREDVVGATIAGGGGEADGAPAPNEVRSHGGTVGGGAGNIAGNADFPVAERRYATVAGGLRNIARHRGAAVAGGLDNIAGGAATFVGSGSRNWAGGSHTVVAGGEDNASPESWTAIPGGVLNCAGGRYSFAGGRRAKVRPGSAISTFPACAGVPAAGGTGDQGSFVWADASNFDFVSAGSNQFRVRATGGVTFVSAIDGSGNASAGVQLNAGAGTWTSLSDRHAKTDIAATDPLDVLARVLALPIHTWRYRGEAKDVRHMGPMAQDFHASFGLNGADDTGIATVDAQGVALAAIQGLNARLEAENADLRGDIDTLRQELAELRALLLPGK